MTSATEVLRRMLDERGVEWWQKKRHTCWKVSKGQEVEMWRAWEAPDGSLTLKVDYIYGLTPEQAIAATLGPTYKPNPVWEKWHKSLRHETVETVGDAVEQLMYEAIEFGGDMGPNGNTCNGIDEGDVLTSGFINEWIARFESTLGRDRCSYEQWREISNAVGDAMEYAHDRAIEHPDRADPLWSLDEYVNRILKVAFEGEVTLGTGTCHDESSIIDTYEYNRWEYELSCGHTIIWEDSEPPRYCPECGRRIEQ